MQIQRQERQDQLRKPKEQRDLEQCTFKPTLVAKPRRKKTPAPSKEQKEALEAEEHPAAGCEVLKPGTPSILKTPVPQERKERRSKKDRLNLFQEFLGGNLSP